MKIGVLCSGNLGLKILQKFFEKSSISFVFTDAQSTNIIDFCDRNRLPIFIGNPRNNGCHDFIKDKYCDVLFSVNYLFIIDKTLIGLPQKYAINIHGSLLPKYRGRTPHVWAIINNEKKTGVTAHLIDEKCDHGAIIEQIEIEIKKDDTGAIILEKFNNLYWPLIEKIILSIEENTIQFNPQDNNKASYFGKRTPKDGHINWNWQKERIYNWIRAQSNPYPGAYAFLNDQKIIIDKISFCDDGFHSETTNGRILSINPIKIKTPNGVVKIDQLREQIDLLSNKTYTLE